LPKAKIVKLRGPTRAQIDLAVGQSPLARMPADARETLLVHATTLHLRSRELFVRSSEADRVGLVVTGFARCFGSTHDGRELTYAWAHHGVILGLGLLAAPRKSVFAWQAVTDMAVLELRADEMRHLGRTNAGVAWAMAEHLGAWLMKALDDLMLYAYGDLRARIAVRLLELACHSPIDGPLVATITQEQLAQAVGASRPSVARVLKQFRTERLVRSLSRGILVERPHALAALLDNPPALSPRLQRSPE
jgi:CRP/FNR family transcriptional regulator